MLRYGSLFADGLCYGIVCSGLEFVIRCTLFGVLPVCSYVFVLFLVLCFWCGVVIVWFPLCFCLLLDCLRGFACGSCFIVVTVF